MKRNLLLLFGIAAMVATACNKDENIEAPEELPSNYRAKSNSSQSDVTKVYEYTPAPGQFINETKTGGYNGEQTTPQKAAAFALERLKSNKFVSLGGFGGYIVVGFDHSIDNVAGYDFAVEGNSFDGSSEPGIVWVMQDSNGDSLPNDVWYELAGSESNSAETISNYAVTYYRPEAAGMAVRWIDNQGGSGEIDYLEAHHAQDYYYPAWITADSYTLRGTRLKERNYDKSGNGSMWVQPAFGWGYTDNNSQIDMLSAAQNPHASTTANLLDIDNAVDSNGNKVELKYIDFVKIQSACNTKSGWTGEMSTEVVGLFDYSMYE